MSTYIFESEKLKVIRNRELGFSVWRRKRFNSPRIRAYKYTPDGSFSPAFRRCFLTPYRPYTENAISGVFINEDLSFGPKFITHDPDLKHVWVSFTNPTKYAYLPKGKKFKLDREYLTRHGRALSLDRLIEKYNLSRCFLEPLYAREFEVTDVYTAYSESAPTSCMTGRTELISFYEEAGADAIVYKENGSIQARAVRWSIDGCYVVDRIYSHTEDALHRLNDYIDEQGWDRREDSEAYHGSFISGNNYLIPAPRLCKIPWLDTFRGAVYRDGQWFIANENSQLDEPLQSEGGSYIGECANCPLDGNCCIQNNLHRCKGCGKHLRANYEYYMHPDYYCEDCHRDNFTECARCGMRFSDDHLTQAKNGSHYCTQCANVALRRCATCGGQFLAHAVHFNCEQQLECVTCFQRTSQQAVASDVEEHVCFTTHSNNPTT